MRQTVAKTVLNSVLVLICGGIGGCGSKHADKSSAPAILARLRVEHVGLPDSTAVEERLSDASREWAALAAKEARAVLEYRAEPGVGSAFALGKLYAQAENFDRARDFLVPLLAEDEGHAGAWAWLGVERIGSERKVEAKALLEHALGLNPDHALGHRALGGLLLEEAQPELARPHLERAFELDPEGVEVALDLARLLEDAGELEPAGEVLERARRVDPLNPSVLFLLARVRRGEGRGLEAEALEKRHARAIAIDDLGLRGASLSAQRVALALGIHYVESGQPALALDEFETAAARGNDGEAIGMALGGRVDALLKLERLGDAREGLEELRQFNSQHGMLPGLEAALDAASASEPTNR